MAYEIIYTDEFEDWFKDLDEVNQDTVAYLVELLEIKGLSLGSPYSSAINGSKHRLRELRTDQHNVPIRVFYAFSPERNAVLLLGGNKAGNPRFYDEMIPIVERIWEQYLAERQNNG